MCCVAIPQAEYMPLYTQIALVFLRLDGFNNRRRADWNLDALTSSRYFAAFNRQIIKITDAGNCAAMPH